MKPHDYLRSIGYVPSGNYSDEERVAYCREELFKRDEELRIIAIGLARNTAAESSSTVWLDPGVMGGYENALKVALRMAPDMILLPRSGMELGEPRRKSHLPSGRTVLVRRLSKTASVPERGSASAAGYDLRTDAQEAVVIRPHETELIGTGIAVAIPEGYFGGIYARSGMAAKRLLRPGNCVGVIDADYRGEVKVALHNDGEEDRVVEPGERVAQLVIQPYLSVSFDEREALPETGRGEGGFGSTGSR